MKFYGHANLQQNEIQNGVLSSLTAFPSSPKQGQIAFVNSTVYICVTAGDLPVWVPMTNEITAYTHTQNTPSQTWTVQHDMNTTAVNVQVYDAQSRMMIPSEIETTGPNTCVISFNSSQDGRAVVVSGYFSGNQRPTYAHTHYQTVTGTSWVINHNLGYNPIIRVFIGNQEVQPTSITFNTSNQATIVFATTQVGYAQLI